MKGSGTHLAIVALGAAVMLGGSGAAAASFDGSWSVSVATTAGACDSSFRFPLQIAHGRVFSSDISGVSGRVNPRGAIQVSIRQGDRSAIGSGRLSGNAGAGRWNGSSASGRCVGQWRATRF
jgi:hypothetical protein